MANYTVSARTNYVKVTDVGELTSQLGIFGCTLESNSANPDMYCIFSPKENDFSITIDAEYGPLHAFDFKKHVMPFVKEEEVLVVMQVGNEKLKYLTGFAMALIRRGEIVEEVSINLESIYKMASDKFSKPLELITGAFY